MKQDRMYHKLLGFRPGHYCMLHHHSYTDVENHSKIMVLDHVKHSFCNFGSKGYKISVHKLMR